MSTKINIVDDARHKNTCLLADRGIFGFLHFYPEIFYINNSFSTFASKVSYSGIKKYSIIKLNVVKFVFRGDFLPSFPL